MERSASSGLYRAPILKSIVSFNQNTVQPEFYAEKLKELEKNCSKDFTLHAIVHNKELMKRVKRTWLHDYISIQILEFFHLFILY